MIRLSTLVCLLAAGCSINLQSSGVHHADKATKWSAIAITAVDGYNTIRISNPGWNKCDRLVQKERDNSALLRLNPALATAIMYTVGVLAEELLLDKILPEWLSGPIYYGMAVRETAVVLDRHITAHDVCGSYFSDTF
jgi:hypothetical protein